MTFPHPEVYLVARVEKILQSGITASAEPYIKTGENTKVGGREEGGREGGGEGRGEEKGGREGGGRRREGGREGGGGQEQEIVKLASQPSYVHLATGCAETGSANGSSVLSVRTVQDALCMGSKVRSASSTYM